MLASSPEPLYWVGAVLFGLWFIGAVITVRNHHND